jgi:hypothetical protein
MEHHFVQGVFNGEWRCTKCLAASGEFPCPYGPVSDSNCPASELSHPLPEATAVLGPRCLKHSPRVDISFNGSICVLKSVNYSRQRFEWTTHALFDRPPIFGNKMTYSVRATCASNAGPMIGWAVETTNVTARLPAMYGMYFRMDLEIQQDKGGGGQQELHQLKYSHGVKNPLFDHHFGSRGVMLNEVVVSVYDMDTRTISFQRGDQAPVIALSDVPASPLLYPCIFVRDSGDIVEFQI